MSDEKKVAKPTGMTIDQLFKQLATQGMEEKPKTMEEYKFWKTQPVTKLDAEVEREGPIETKTVDEVDKEPFKLPGDFEWCTIDISDPDQVNEIYDLLYHNYIEDADEEFRFKYSPEFLNWALKPPGWHKDWSVGVRVKKENKDGKKKLVAFIAGVPAKIQVRENTPVDIAEINFLCVHKQLRSKRLAPVLIREVTRRVNAKNVWQALYTAGTILPSPITKARYYHRSINWPTLYDVGFSPLPVGSTPAKQVARFSLPQEQTDPNMRPMVEADVPVVKSMLERFSERYEVKPVFTEEEVKHWLTSQDQVVYSYVVEQEGKITDFVSFYGLESSVLNNPKHDSIKVAYSFYYASEAGIGEHVNQSELNKRLKNLFQQALIHGKNKGYDVFNALTIQDNPTFLDELKFGPGDGYLNYYLFNYQAFPVHGGINEDLSIDYQANKGVGVVML